jgi:hypothetical protein
MKKSVLFLMSAALLLGSNVMADDQPQVPNGDFESWTFDGENLPDNWNSYQTATGDLAGSGYSKSERQVKRSTDIRPGSTGQYSCAIWARAYKVFGITVAKPQGNLTSGRMSAGSMTPADKANYNYTDREGAASANGKAGVPCAIPFTGKPKSVKVWVKYIQAGKASAYGEHNKAKFSAIIHDDADYISYGLASDDTEENKALVVASAVKEIAYSGGEWEELEIPFVYTNNEAKPAYIQINASTNAYPGAGEVNDYLYIDDIEMVYEESGDEKTVTGEKVFSNDLLRVIINGNESDPMPAVVNVTEYSDNTIDFSLKNFAMSSYDEDEEEWQTMYVGNITVKDIAASTSDGITNFAFKNSIFIEKGDYDKDERGMPITWMGPIISKPNGIPLDMSGKYNNDHLYVTIDIDMSTSIGQVIKVKLGNEEDVTSITTLKSAKKNAASGVIYDLNGRKVNEMQRGRFYIVDGKIVMN